MILSRRRKERKGKSEKRRRYAAAEAAQTADYDEGQIVLKPLNAQYGDIPSWADMCDSAGFEAKRMIVHCLTGRIEVFRDYKLHIDFKIDLAQFSFGIDIPATAA